MTREEWIARIMGLVDEALVQCFRSSQIRDFRVVACRDAVEAALREVPPAEPVAPTDDEVIARAKAAGIRWLAPDDEEERFPGGFDMCSMLEMRALLRAGHAAEGPPAEPPMGTDAAAMYGPGHTAE